MFAGVAALAGCAGGSEDGRASLAGVEAAERSVRDARSEPARKGSTPTAARPAALVANELVTWADLQGPLAEAAGAMVLEEVSLDRLLEQEMRVRGLSLPDGAVEREEELLGQTLALTAGVDASRQGALVHELRRSRGLGERRYRSLLRRNAMLRAMTRNEVLVSADDLRQAFQIRYGERYRARMILVRTEREAAGAMDRIRSGETFADVAMAVSIDPSAFRGGFVGTISPADPTYPIAIRRAIASTPPGTPSGVAAIEQGYAIMLVEEVVPPETGVAFEQVSASLEHEVRLIRERGAMDRLASQLLRTSEITVLDPSLNWSWESRRREDQ